MAGFADRHTPAMERSPQNENIAPGWRRRQESDRYIDGIDQRGFLFADDGESHHERICMWAEYTPMAIRMYEYKLPLLDDVPATIQERAWGSPIWYGP